MLTVLFYLQISWKKKMLFYFNGSGVSIVY